MKRCVGMMLLVAIVGSVAGHALALDDEWYRYSDYFSSPGNLSSQWSVWNLSASDMVIGSGVLELAPLSPSIRGPATSVQNILPAAVERIGEVEGGLVDVRLDMGAPITARITRKAKRDLALAPGQQVFVMIKSVAVSRGAFPTSGTAADCSSPR